MALTSTPLAAPAGSAREVKDTNINATAQNGIVSGVTKVAAIVVDNTLNAAAVYAKIYDTGGTITVGTTVPDEVIYVRAGKVRRVDYLDDKLEMANGLGWACVTAGGTGGTTSPTSAVTIVATIHA